LRFAFLVSGGLTRTGEAPRGGAIVLANRSSTVDRWALRAAGIELASTVDCAVAACRRAAAAGLPVVPVGIAGTAGLLDAEGALHPRPVAVHIGRPLWTSDPDAVSRAVAALAAQPVPRADSRLRRAVSRLAWSPWGLAVVAAWALAEAVSWPLLPEFLLAIVAVAAPRRAPKLALVAALASLIGGVLMYALAVHGWTPPAPLTTARMHASAASDVAAHGAAALRHQPLSGIPYKVYALMAGRAHVSLPGFVAASTAGRGVRILAVGLFAGCLGGVLNRWRRWYPAYLAVFVSLFTAALAATVRAWS
jgi:membrane protein YqaA with SNARE-associated domain